MKPRSKQILLGMLSGSLLTLGFGAAFVSAWLFWLFRQMFIVGVRSPAIVLSLLLCPFLFVCSGSFVGGLAFRSGDLTLARRIGLGILLITVPFLAATLLAPAGVLLGATGMDIHWRWNVPKALGYAILLGALIALCSLPPSGIRLLRKALAR